MKQFVLLLLVLGIALAAVEILLQLDDVRDLFVSPPEKLVQNFVAQLAGERYENAAQALDHSLQTEMDAEDLKTLDHALKARFGIYRFQLGGVEKPVGDTKTTYEAHLATERAGEQIVPFPLERDPITHLWHISSLDELERIPHRQSLRQQPIPADSMLQRAWNSSASSQ